MLRELGIKVDSGEQFDISFKGTEKNIFVEIREILEMFLGNKGTQIPLGFYAI